MSGINILSDSHFFTSLVELRGGTFTNNIPLTKEKQPGGVAHNKVKGTFFVGLILHYQRSFVKHFYLTPRKCLHLKRRLKMNNSIINMLSSILIAGNGQADAMAIYILQYLIELSDSLPHDAENYFRYDYCNLRKNLNISHKVLRCRLKRLMDCSFIEFKTQNVKGDKKDALFIRIINSKLTVESDNTPSENKEQPASINCTFPQGNMDVPTETKPLDIFINTNHDLDNDIDSDSTSPSKNGITGLLTQITDTMSVAESKTPLRFGSLSSLFKFDLCRWVSPSGFLSVGDTLYPADDYLQSISMLSVKSIENVIKRINAKSPKYWDTYVLKSLYNKSQKQHRVVQHVPKEAPRKAYELKTNYDFNALQQFIYEN